MCYVLLLTKAFMASGKYTLIGWLAFPDVTASIRRYKEDKSVAAHLSSEQRRGEGC